MSSASSPRRGLRPRPTDSRVGTAEHFRWLEGIVKSLLVLNLLDAVFTLVWIQAGLAREANALMRDLINHHAVLFVVVKTFLVAAGSYLLWHRRHRPTAVVGIFIAFLAYYTVLLYHLQYSSYLADAVMR
jgi:drug/metabolite transporter (DMT)-like permease